MATDILVTPEKYAEIQIPTSITTSTVIHFQYQNYNYDAIIILFNDCPDNDLFILYQLYPNKEGEKGDFTRLKATTEKIIHLWQGNTKKTEAAKDQDDRLGQRISLLSPKWPEENRDKLDQLIVDMANSQEFENISVSIFFKNLPFWLEKAILAKCE